MLLDTSFSNFPPFAASTAVEKLSKSALSDANADNTSFSTLRFARASWNSSITRASPNIPSSAANAEAKRISKESIVKRLNFGKAATIFFNSSKNSLGETFSPDNSDISWAR